MVNDEESTTLSDRITKAFLNIIALFVAFTVSFVFLIGIYDFANRNNDNNCNMTWMYQYPTFVELPLENEYDTKFPMYRLYIYAEGRDVESFREEEFTGIPVLFLPGNAGSYKQIRSIASVALYKAYDNNAPFHFDFFTIDFNEEMSGLYGYVLNRQLEYARAALEKIMSFYEDYHHVVLIGHSMGGVIAKSINVGDLKVHLIITLATPHLHPVLIMDPEFDKFYYHANRNLSQLHGKSNDLRITTVSIAGGDEDLIVSSKLTQSPTNSFQTSVSRVPGAWVETDHLCILWCNQFVLPIVRILFDLVEYKEVSKHNDDSNYLSFTRNQKKIDSILSYHLYKRSSGKSVHYAHPKEDVTMPMKADWIELLTNKYEASGSDKKQYLMFPLLSFTEKIKGDPNNFQIMVSTTNTKPKNWLFGCTSQRVYNNIRYCSELENLSSYGEIQPRKRKTAHLDYSKIKKYSHLVVKTFPKNSRYNVNWEVYEETESSRRLQKKFNTNHRQFFNFSLQTLEHRFLAWHVEVKNRSVCNKNTSFGVFRHDNFQTHQFFSEGNLLIRFYNWSSTQANLLMYFAPECDFNVTIKIAPVETAGQLFRSYISILPSYIASVILLTMFFQYHHEEWKNFHLLLLENAFNLILVPGLIIGLCLAVVPSDYLKIMDKAEVSVFLPMFCYATAFGIVFLFTAGGWYFLIGSGNALHAVLVKFIQRNLGKIPEKVTDYAIDLTFAKFPVVISVFLISLATATCGGLAIFFGFILYLIKIFKMYEDLLDDLLRGKIKDVKDGLSPINFHTTLSALWFIVALLNLPSVIHWTKNVGYGESPQWDMSMYVSLMLTPAVAILWQDFAPNFNPYEKFWKTYIKTFFCHKILIFLWKMQRYMSYATALMIVMWGTHRLYIISFFLVMHLITLAFSQLFSCLLDMATKNEERRQRELSAASETTNTNVNSNGAPPLLDNNDINTENSTTTPDNEEKSESQSNDEETGEEPQSDEATTKDHSSRNVNNENEKVTNDNVSKEELINGKEFSEIRS